MSEPYRQRLLTQVAAPAVEPLTLAETKTYLRVDTADEDTLITQLIATARRAAEQYLRRSLITQQWKLAYDDYLPCDVPLPMGPVQSIVRVTTVTIGGSSTDISTSLYALNAAKTRLLLEQYIAEHQVEIVYQAGFGAAGTNVPEPIRQGMLAHIAEIYDGRSRAQGAPQAAIALYHPYREVTL